MQRTVVGCRGRRLHERQQLGVGGGGIRHYSVGLPTPHRVENAHSAASKLRDTEFMQ